MHAARAEQKRYGALCALAVRPLTVTTHVQVIGAFLLALAAGVYYWRTKDINGGNKNAPKSVGTLFHLTSSFPSGHASWPPEDIKKAADKRY